MKLLEQIKKNLRVAEIPFALWEMIFIRLVFAWLLYKNLPKTIPWASQNHPNGLAKWLDFTWLSDVGIYGNLYNLGIVALVLYALGILQPLALTYLSLLFIAIGTLENSQGAIEHYLQLVVLVLATQTIVSWWQIFSTKERKFVDFLFVSKKAEQKMVHWSRIMIAGAYLACAITKIDRSHGRWLWDTPNLSVQIIKTHANDWANTGYYPGDFFMETLPNWIASYPMISRVVFAPGLLLELFLVLGLLGRVWSLVMGLSVIILHKSIDILMSLPFANHETLIWIFYVNVPYWAIFCFKQLVTCQDKVKNLDKKRNFSTAENIVIIDGVCVLCNRFSQWLIRVDQFRKYKLALWQDQRVQELIISLGKSRPFPDAIALVTENRKVYFADEAIWRICSGLPWPYSILGFLRIFPRCIRRAGYNWVAKNRYLWFGKLPVVALNQTVEREVLW